MINNTKIILDEMRLLNKLKHSEELCLEVKVSTQRNYILLKFLSRSAMLNFGKYLLLKSMNLGCEGVDYYINREEAVFVNKDHLDIKLENSTLEISVMYNSYLNDPSPYNESCITIYDSDDDYPSAEYYKEKKHFIETSIVDNGTKAKLFFSNRFSLFEFARCLLFEALYGDNSSMELYHLDDGRLMYGIRMTERSSRFFIWYNDEE